MMTLSVNDRISYKGEKATVKQIWKKKVKVILSDLSEMTVGVDDVMPWIETVEGQIPLIDLSRYEARRGFTDWELENENAIEPLTPESVQPEDAIETEDAIGIDIQSLTTDQLTTLYESVTRELINRGECLPNLDPNPDPNLIDPNSDPNSDPNLIDPNSHPIDGYEEIKTIKGRQYRYWRWYENDKKRSKYLGRCGTDKKSC
jgi:hypothetical protein